jgi:hypothetical protein
MIYIIGRILTNFYQHLTSLPQRLVAMSHPTTHRSVTVIDAGKVEVQEKAVPAFGDEEILVRVRSVALNPLDWRASSVQNVVTTIFNDNPYNAAHRFLSSPWLQYRL